MTTETIALPVYALLFALSVAAGLRAPRYGIVFLIALAPFAFYFGLGATTLTLSKAALVGVGAGLLLRPIPWPIFRSVSFVRLSLAGTLLVLTTAFSIVHAQFADAAIRETLKACEYLLLFAVVYAAHRVDPSPRTLRVTIALTVLGVALTALFQEWHGAPSRLLIDGHTIPRIAGTLEGPNQLAGYLGVAVPLLAALNVDRFERLTALTLAIASAALVLTFSRAGILSTILAVAVVLIVSNQRTRATAATFVAGLALGLGGIVYWALATGSLAVLGFWGVETANPGSVGTHSQLWRAAMMLWRRHPLYGVGAGNFELALPSIGLQAVRTHANSLYLQNLAEQGLPGIAATLLLIWQSIASFIRDARTSPFVLGALAASLGLAVHQIVDLIVFYPKVGAWWWIVMAIGAAELRHFHKYRISPAARVARRDVDSSETAT